MVPLSADVSPVMRLNRVVLPAPLGPMRPAISPSATDKLTLSTAFSPSKERLTPLSSSTGPHPLPFGGPLLAAPPGAQALHRCSGDKALGPENHENDESRAVHHRPVAG